MPSSASKSIPSACAPASAPSATRSITMSSAERKWVMFAVLIIVIGVIMGILHQIGYVPLWLSTTSTVLMGVAAITAAIIATRASNRNEKNG